MPYLKWNEKLSLGITKIDEEHKGLIDILNRLHETMMDEDSQQDTGELIQKLAGYAMAHFSTEEEYFKQLKYPEASSHIEEHDQFRAKIKQFTKSNEEGDVTLLFPVVNMLKDWIEKHIQIIDRKYVEFFKSNGLK